MTNLYLYYLATRPLTIHDWFNGGWSDPAYCLELHTMGFSSIQGMLYGAVVPRALPEVTRGVFLAWRASLRHTHWAGRLTQYTPLWYGTRLREVASLSGFRQWVLIRVTLLGDVWSGTHIRSFQDLQARYSIPPSQFFSYLQLRHALHSHIPEGTSLPEYSPPEARYDRQFGEGWDLSDLPFTYQQYP